MGVKPARHSYTREEILDILQRNAALYKDEEGFVEFFTELALYLLQVQVDNPGRGEPWPEPSPLDSREIPMPIGLSSNREAPAPMASDSDEDEDEMLLPPTVAQLKQRATQDAVRPPSQSPPPYQGTGPVPPPPSPNMGQSQEWDLPSGLYPVGQHEEAPEEKEEKPRSSLSRQNIEVDRVSLTPYNSEPKASKKLSPQSFREPASRPTPEPAPPPEKAGEDVRKSDDKGFVQRNIGKAKVYKVSRSYRSSTSAEVPCRVCGSMIPLGAQHCPSCGTPAQ